MKVRTHLTRQYLVTAGKPTLTRHIYPYGLLASLTELPYMPIYGQIGMPSDEDWSHRVSHFTIALYLDGAALYADVTILDTPEGVRLEHLLDRDEMCFRLEGLGDVYQDGNHLVIGGDYRIRGIHAVPLREAA